MQYSPHLPKVHISLDAVAANCRLLHGISAAARAGHAAPEGLVPGPDGRDTPVIWPSQMEVIKADAYGHGHIQVAATLLRGGARMFASGSVQEAAVLRQGLNALPDGGERPLILALLGLAGPEDAALCARLGIIPVIHSFDQLPLLASADAPLAVALKCNTGMSRLGFNEDEISLLPEAMKAWPGARPVLVLSHLHSADTDGGREQAGVQGRVFARVLAGLRAAWPRLAASLGNSAGTLLAEEISRHIGPHICRPGLALYGSNPFEGTALEALGAGLRPAMSVSAPVLAVRELSPGDGIGYGHTFTAPHRVRVGIVAAGYADSYARGLSNKGVMCVDGARAPVLGRVSMQMTAVSLDELPEEAPRPRTAWILGGPHANAVSAAELSRLWGTIPYEVYCLLGYNERVYED